MRKQELHFYEPFLEAGVWTVVVLDYRSMSWEPQYFNSSHYINRNPGANRKYLPNVTHAPQLRKVSWGFYLISQKK